MWPTQLRFLIAAGGGDDDDDYDGGHAHGCGHDCWPQRHKVIKRIDDLGN